MDLTCIKNAVREREDKSSGKEGSATQEKFSYSISAQPVFQMGLCSSPLPENRRADAHGKARACDGQETVHQMGLFLILFSSLILVIVMT